MDLHEATTPVRTDEDGITAWEAKFASTATGASDELMVTIPGYDDGDQHFGPVKWKPDPGPAYPSAGDEAVVVQTDTGQWVVLVWFP